MMSWAQINLAEFKVLCHTSAGTCQQTTLGYVHMQTGNRIQVPPCYESGTMPSGQTRSGISAIRIAAQAFENAHERMLIKILSTIGTLSCGREVKSTNFANSNWLDSKIPFARIVRTEIKVTLTPALGGHMGLVPRDEKRSQLGCVETNMERYLLVTSTSVGVTHERHLLTNAAVPGKHNARDPRGSATCPTEQGFANQKELPLRF